ncbi:class I SAM-dependent methyltransferase [Compostibacter hankyongensis]|uniref:Class I SAM-dependent methyltransferase n=1 Tax=Compostibacter hankyongensis TaxID=1007089 RepID=A0ABP8FD45_9BACT
MEDIIRRFDIDTGSCLEFGVEFGFSTTVFANYFKTVTGVDLFTGDPHAGRHENNFLQMQESVRPWPNISLVQADYRDFIREHGGHYDMIHVDIIHNFRDTFRCGLWAAQHSKVTLFHDTESYPAVKRAVSRVARETGKQFYNYPRFFGLGIIA